MTRKSVFAGSFYPENKDDLEEMIEEFMRKADVDKIEKLKGIVVPHAGYVYSGEVAANGFKLLSFLPEKEWKVIMLGPSHTAWFEGAALSTEKEWETPLGKVKLIDAGNLIKKSRGLVVEKNEAHEQEHCLEIELPFLQTALKKFKILPMVLGEINEKRLAELLSDEIDKDTIIVVSSDLSHYLPYDQAIAIDSFANGAIPALDIKTVEKKVEACGKSGILTLMNIAKIKGWKGKFIEYMNSGDTAGDKEQVVGYGCYAFFE